MGAAEVILPNEGDVHVPLGLPQLTWLRVLYASARNWKLYRSRKRKVFAKAVSKLMSPGPWKRFGPALPYVYCAGSAKALLFTQALSTLPQLEAWIGPTRLGRWLVAPVLA